MPITAMDRRAALVVIDLQRGVVAARTTPHSSADVITRTVVLADAFHARSLPVILVHVTAASDGSDAPPGRTTSTGAAARGPTGGTRSSRI